MMVHSWNTQHVLIRYVDTATGNEGYLQPDVIAFSFSLFSRFLILLASFPWPEKINTIMQQLGIVVMLCLFLPVAFSTEKN